MYKIKMFFMAAALLLVFGLSTVSEAKDPQPVGKVTISDTQLGFIVGGSWGKGVLSYNGVDYEFKIKGLKLGTIGISKVSAVGDVYNMTELSQFSGTYIAGQAGIAIAGGVGGTVLQNQNKVHIKLSSTQKGASLNVGVDGITIELKDAIGKAGSTMEGSKTYRVSTGDNLYEISRKYGTTVENLKAINGLTGNIIYVGQELIVP